MGHQGIMLNTHVSRCQYKVGYARIFFHESKEKMFAPLCKNSRFFLPLWWSFKWSITGQVWHFGEDFFYNFWLVFYTSSIFDSHCCDFSLFSYNFKTVQKSGSSIPVPFQPCKSFSKVQRFGPEIAYLWMYLFSPY